MTNKQQRETNEEGDGGRCNFSATNKETDQQRTNKQTNKTNKQNKQTNDKEKQMKRDNGRWRKMQQMLQQRLQLPGLHQALYDEHDSTQINITIFCKQKLTFKEIAHLQCFVKCSHPDISGWARISGH